MQRMKKAISFTLIAAMVMTGGISLGGLQNPQSAKAAAKASTAQTTGNKARAKYKKYMGKNKTIKVQYIDGYDFENAQTGKFKTKAKKINLKKYLHYAFQDVNQDGVPELLVSNKKRSQGYGRVLICTYSKGKVVPMLCVEGIRSGVYAAKKKQLCFGFGASNEKTYVFTKMSKNTIKHVVTYRDETTRLTGGKKKHTYFKNSGKVKKATYNKAKKNVLDKIDV